MTKAVDKAYHTVRERIVRGVYPASSRITELEVAAVAGVSRTPVREALRKLHAEGLLEFIPHQGAIVTEWTPEDREDVYELRATLEAYGAARAARRINPEGIAELRQLAEDQYHETLAKPEGYLERVGILNSQFHRRIHQFAGSPRLVTALASLIEAPMMLRTFTTYQDEDLIRSASHHLEIVRALEARDGDWSAALMRSHILGARGSLAA
ncbi:MAG TPA: GntR family transcriptional regulator [Steroidobacter sp.]|uniref:GntR family transcriptional regulator n=1 Tax=Steroidobacter sp. TaxID=1978227 RepID=UPI002ED969CD